MVADRWDGPDRSERWRWEAGSDGREREGARAQEGGKLEGAREQEGGRESAVGREREKPHFKMQDGGYNTAVFKLQSCFKFKHTL